MQRPPLQYVNVATRAWKNFDQELFRADLLSSRLCCTADGYAGMTVDDLQGLYDAVMADLLEKHAPRRTVRRRYQPMTPWFDSDCAAARRRTRALERRYRRSKSSVDRAAWVDQARSMHRMYTWKQNTYWEQKVAESRGNPKRLWKTLDAVMCKDRLKKTRPVDSLTADGFLKAFEEKVESVRASTASAAYPVFDGDGCICSL